MKKIFLSLMTLLITLPAYASDSNHPMSKIIGKDIELFTVGHTIAGRIQEKLIFGDVGMKDGHKTSTLTLKERGQRTEMTFGPSEDKTWGGEIKLGDKKLNIQFLKLDRETPAYYFLVNEKEYRIRVEADDFKNHHFINPTYILELEDQEVRAKLENGQACYMYSLHLMFMIFGSYLF